MTASIHRLRETCRGCGGRDLRRFLRLGPTPLANSFLKTPEEFAGEPSFPLDVYFCPACSLVQLLDVIDPEVMFRNYLYVTGTSDTIAAHNVEYARTVVELLEIGADDLVIEVASNDGSLLKRFQDHGVRTLGIEPATNIAEMATADGVETINRFLDAESAEEIRAERGPARAVIGNNVLAHVDETQGFLRGCRTLLGEGGRVIVEVPYLGPFLDRLEYDTVYHEHFCYFSVTALMRLAEATDLSIVRVDHVPVHGGSIRVYAARKEDQADHSPEVQKLAEREREQGFTDWDRYGRFTHDVEENRRAILGLLRELKESGKLLAAYGAPAKGNTLLNYCGIDTDLIPYTVDKSPLKVGLYAPGSHIPVLPVSTLLERRPDYVLILAWNFADEILRQQQEFRSAGGRFIIPIPEPKVV